MMPKRTREKGEATPQIKELLQTKYKHLLEESDIQKLLSGQVYNANNIPDDVHKIIMKNNLDQMVEWYQNHPGELS